MARRAARIYGKVYLGTGYTSFFSGPTFSGEGYWLKLISKPARTLLSTVFNNQPTVTSNCMRLMTLIRLLPDPTSDFTTSERVN